MFFGNSNFTPIKIDFGYKMLYSELKKNPEYKNSKINYITKTIVDCRLRGICKQLRYGKYAKVKFIISDMINNMKHASIDMNRKEYNDILNEFYHMLVEMAFRKYNSVHDRVRDLHYKLNYN